MAHKSTPPLLTTPHPSHPLLWPTRAISLLLLLQAIGMMSMVVAGVAMGGVLGQAPPAGMQLDPGVTLRVYHVEGDLKAIPTLVKDQTPNFDELRTTIDFRDDVGFGYVPG